ncbi:MAG: hypothetical protein Q4G21_06230 [Dermabacter sp.]|nr:hypothetical protein [Dermabacter sp.]
MEDKPPPNKAPRSNRAWRAWEYLDLTYDDPSIYYQAHLRRLASCDEAALYNAEATSKIGFTGIGWTIIRSRRFKRAP